MKKIKKCFGIMITMLFLFGMLFQNLSFKIEAQSQPKEINVKITKFELQSTQFGTIDTVWYGSKFYLALNWDATHVGPTIHKDDYFEIQLPDKFVFKAVDSDKEFDVENTDGTAIGHAVVTTGPNDVGGKIRVTFNETVENKYNVKGTLRLAARFNRDAVQYDVVNTFTISAYGQVITVPVTINGPSPINYEEYITKWGIQIKEKPTEAHWQMRLNFQKGNHTNLVIKDKLVGGIGDETYVPGTFKLRRARFDQFGSLVEDYEITDVSQRVVLAPDNRSFELNLGTVNGDQFLLEYHTTYHPGSVLKNTGEFVSTTVGTKIKNSYFIDSSSAGTGQGDLASKIKIIKVDALNTETKLPNAIFTVFKPDGSSFELTTDANGEVESNVLEQGTYKVKETHAPRGYLLDDTPYDFEVTPAGGAIKVITNKPILTTVSVEKKWNGQKLNQVNVKLFADGIDTTKQVVLSEGNNWKYTFENLRQFKPDGTPIKYTVKEETLPNYTTDITGTQENGYVITNTNSETTTINVSKTWVGPKTASVEVKVYNENDLNNVLDTLTLNETSAWKATSKALPKYNADGSLAKYVIRETAMPNYDITITGDQTSGFTIQNINNETTLVEIEKHWVGKALDEVSVELLQDGKVIETVKLNKANNFKVSITDLPKYDESGKEHLYNVKEVEVKGYSVKVERNLNKFIITNTEKPTKPPVDTSDTTNLYLFTATLSLMGLVLLNKMNRKV